MKDGEKGSVSNMRKKSHRDITRVLVASSQKFDYRMRAESVHV